MISIVEAISDLLFIRDAVVVPGLGAFTRHDVSATIDEETNRFAPPSSRLEFDASKREDNDLITNYVSEKNDCSKASARQQLMLFVTEVFNQLKDVGKVELERIGTLSYNSENQIVFEPDETTNYNADAFGLGDLGWKPIVNEEVEEESNEETEREPVKVTKGAWIFTFAMILVMSVLFYFKVYYPKEEKEGQLTEEEMGRRTPAEDLQMTEEKIVEMVDRIIKEELSKIPIEKPSEDTIRIIAGCYDQEEFAERMVNSLKRKGFLNAFKEQHGERWFVAYDRYHTEEEAYAALREIRESGKGKGWILK